MADALGTWFTADIDLTKLLEPIQPVLDAVDGVLELLINVLNVLQAVLETVKAFLVGLLDPIRAIVEAIINEIRAFIQDLRNLGAYFYLGDVNRVSFPYQDLVGGYAGFQRRMLSAYVDTSDPKRPAFSGTSTVLSVYFYLSVQVTDLYKIIELVVAICRFFGGLTKKSRPYPAPVPVAVTYGTSQYLLSKFGTLGVALSSGDDVEYALVEWRMPAGGQAFIGSAGPAPNGFIIDVCTEPDGFFVWADGPDPKSNAPGSEGTARVRYNVVDPALSNTPLRVFGGLDTVAFATPSSDPETTEGVNVNATYAFLSTTQTQSSAALIVLSELARLEREDNRRYLGRSFFVKNGLFRSMAGGQTFMAVIPKRLLPYTGEFSTASPSGNEVEGKLSVAGAYQPNTYSVVVRAVSNDVADVISSTASGGRGTISDPQYDFKPLFYVNDATVRGVTGSVVVPQRLNGDFSPLSVPSALTFPGPVAEAIAAALVVALLSRSDLVVADPSQGFQPNTALSPTGLETVAADLFKYMRVNNPNKYFGNRTPTAFRGNLRTKVYGYLSAYLPKLGQSLLLVEESDEAVGTLLNFKWSDLGSQWPALTLLETLADTSQGTGLFPSSAFLQPPKYPTVTALQRAPGFGQSPTAGARFVYTQGSCDDAPVLVGRDPTADLAFCRNLIPDEVYGAVLTILLLSTPPRLRTEGGQWANVLLFPNGFPQLLAILDNVEAFLLAILDGLQGIADAIIAFIEAIQARITQLQALLEQIRALLDILATLRLGNVSVLVTVESGTTGAIRALLTAENPPVDTAADYGFGFALVLGGPIPTVAFDLVASVFAAAGE
jgi:hypothetical protein